MDQKATFALDEIKAGVEEAHSAGKPVSAHAATEEGVRRAVLGGVNTYAGRVEDRHTLGDGRPPAAADLERAATLARRVGLGAVALAVAYAVRRR